MTNEKSRFGESVIGTPRAGEIVWVNTMDLPDAGLIFNAQRVGPTTFKGLRENDYDEGFRMPTMPELVPLVHASLENKNYNTAKNVVKTLKKDWITGDTGILYVPEGMLVQDNPELKDGRISMNQEVLEKRLGSHKERGVIFSDDKSIRFVHYGFKKEFQTPLELSTNTGVIALVGGEENAEKIAKASEHYKIKPCFWALEKGPSVTRVAGLNTGTDFFARRLLINADDVEDFNRYSFGVQKIKQEGKQ